MELTSRALWTMIHGMGFGALFLLACSGALVELRRFRPSHSSSVDAGQARFLRIYLFAMAALAWITVLTGTYVIYPWYRALPPAGTPNLSDFPQQFLLSNPSTSGWHTIGMEWKEHVAWLIPIAITMAAAVVAQYGDRIRQYPSLWNGVRIFVMVSMLSAGIAGFFGAMLVKTAPVQGGVTIRVLRGSSQ